MIRKPPRGLFVTGTDTDVGKTYVAASITRALRHAGHRVGVYKPVASGCRQQDGCAGPDDARALWQAAGRPGKLDEVCPQFFEAPLAPHLAARAENREVDSGLLRRGLEPWCDACDIVIVEGAGGLMSPLSDHDYVADLAYDLAYPLIVVAPNVIGVINQTLQTLIAAANFREGLCVAGIVLNDIPRSTSADASVGSNEHELRRRAAAPVLCRVLRDGDVGERIDWYGLGVRPEA
jgi:dethiobiotin synthetase